MPLGLAAAGNGSQTMTPRRTHDVRCRNRRRHRRLRLETLEVRRVLATFIVTTATDVVDTNDSLTSLREAIDSANGTTGADNIVFDSAVFAGASKIDLLLGQFEVTEDLVIEGPGQHLLTIDALGNSRHFDFSASGDLTLEGLTLVGGRTNDADANSSESGGAIRFASSGTLTLNQVTVTGNSTGGAGARGGAIFADQGDIVLLQSTVSHNSTSGTGAKGGGLFAGSGSVTLSDSTVSGNTTNQEGARGGGVYADSGVVSLLRSSIVGNTTLAASADGGGLFANAGATLEASEISGNTTVGEDSDGGGIFANASLTVLRSDISGNATRGLYSSGGAVAFDSATVSIRDSSIANNQTSGEQAHGAGIFAVRSDVTISGSTISGNRTSGTDASGGGIGSFFGSLSIASTTIAANTAAAAGGGIGFSDTDAKTLRLENSIVARNLDDGTAPDFLAPQNMESLTVLASLVGDNTGTLLGQSQVPDSNGNLVGDPSGDGTIDPLLDQLKRLGMTRVHPLLAGSVAVNAGSNALAASIPFDQRGEPFARVAASVVDMGSFEQQTINPDFLIVTTTADELDFGNSDVSLREAISVANRTVGADVIRFDSSSFSDVQTIQLSAGELLITDSVSIEGPGSERLSIDAAGASRVIDVAETDADVMLSGVTITGGATTQRDAGGGGIRFLATGSLTLTQSVVTNNHTGGENADGGGISAPWERLSSTAASSRRIRRPAPTHAAAESTLAAALFCWTAQLPATPQAASLLRAAVCLHTGRLAMQSK